MNSERHKPAMITHEKIEIWIASISINEIEFIVKNLLTEKSQAYMADLWILPNIFKRYNTSFMETLPEK